MPRKPTGQPRGRPKGSGQLGEQTRLTVRIPLALFQRLEAHAEKRIYTRGTPQLAFCVREALEQYLDDKRQTINNPAQPIVISGQTVNILPVEDTTPTIAENEIGQTINMLPHATDNVGQTSNVMPDGDTAQVEPASEPSADDPETMQERPTQQRVKRSPMRQAIIALLQEHSEGMNAHQIRVDLVADKNIRDTLHGMVRDRLIEKQGTGNTALYVVRENL